MLTIDGYCKESKCMDHLCYIFRCTCRLTRTVNVSVNLLNFCSQLYWCMNIILWWRQNLNIEVVYIYIYIYIMHKFYTTNIYDLWHHDMCFPGHIRFLWMINKDKWNMLLNFRFCKYICVCVLLSYYFVSQAICISIKLITCVINQPHTMFIHNATYSDVIIFWD